MKTSAKFVLSAFGDEIADDLHDQLKALRELRVDYLELRGAWGKNVLHFDGDDVASVRQACAEHGIGISCIGSPVGKSPIVAPIEHELTNLRRIFQVAEALDTQLVRVFSFHPPETNRNAGYNAYLDQATSRVSQMAELAEREGYYLMLENEKGVVGDTMARCHAILSGVDSPHLRFAWDPANFVQVGETQPTERGWPLLGAFVGHVHIKDARLADGSVTPAGEGDGQAGELLSKLQDNEYRGFLALEPHLSIAGASGGFSGPDGMARAVDALRKLMAERGLVENY